MQLTAARTVLGPAAEAMYPEKVPAFGYGVTCLLSPRFSGISVVFSIGVVRLDRMCVTTSVESGHGAKSQRLLDDKCR